MILQLQIALLKMSVLILQLSIATSSMPIENKIRENSVNLALNTEKVANRILVKESAEKVANFAKKGHSSDQIDQTSTTIKQYLAEVAEKQEIPLDRMLWIVEKESNFETNRVGDLDKQCPDGRQMRSRGLWQITNCWHDISDVEAFDVVSSTIYAIPYLKEKPILWSSYKFCHQWYSDCPF